MNQPTSRLGHLHYHTRRVSGGLWPYVAGTIIILAIVGGLLRLGLPLLETSRPEIERWFSATLRHPVSIESLELQWRGWAPEVLLSGVALRNPDSGETAIHLADIRFRLGLWSSVVNLRPVPSRLILSKGGFSLSRDARGRIHVRGVKSRGNIDLAALFFTPERIEIRSAEMVWQDQMLGTPPVTFSDVSVRIHNAGNHHELNGRATVPGDSARRVRFALALSGDPLSSDWDAQVHLSTQALPLQPMPFDKLHPEFKIFAGEADLELWSTWRKARLVSGEARFRLAGVHASFADHVVPVRWTRGIASYRREGNDWRLAVDELELVTNRGRWPQSGIEITVAGSEAKRQIGGRLRFLDLGDSLPAILALAPLDKGLKDWLRAARPSGELRDVTILYRPDSPAEERLLLKARLDAIALQPHGDRPGFEGLSGSLQIGGTEGRFGLDSSALVANLPHLFPKPLEADTALGELSWERTDESWQLVIEHLEVSNLDSLIRLAGTLDWTDDDPSPFLDIRARFENGNAGSIPDYLPVHVMPKRAASWLMHAVPSGAITDGGLVLRGRASDFPFEKAQGRFEVRANLTGAILDYSPNWPRVEEIDAELVINGGALDIYATSGKVFEADLLEGHGRIPNLRSKPPVLEMQGKISSSGRDGLRFLMESPLEKKFKPSLGDADISGQLAIALDLDLILGKRIEMRHIDGSLNFDGNSVRARTVGLELDELSGTVNFTAESLTGEGLAARVWGLPITLSAEDVEVAGESLTRFRAEGRISDTDLLRLLKGSSPGSAETEHRLGRRIRGESTWRVSLDVPKGVGQDGVLSTLLLESDLKGMTLDFPQPLGKEPEETRRLILGVVLGGRQENVVRLGYDEDLKAALALRRDNGGTRLTRGAVYVGAARGELPETDGLFVFADLERFSSTEWLNVLHPADADATTIEDRAPPATMDLPLRQIDIKAREFELVGQWIDTLHLQADRAEDGTWRARLNGKTLAGTLTIPGARADQPVSMVFERLKLHAPKREGTTAQDQGPRELPPLEFSCDDFSFGDLPLGRLSLVTKPQAGGLRIEQLTMEGDGYRIDASGDWWFTQGEEMSRFKIHVKSSDHGDLLKSFGYDKVLKGGEVELVIDANWRGAPGDFSLDRINGLVYYRADRGRLTDVDPGGAGRVFGLLSVQALPRRLRLDFSDLFKEGFAYDRIEGNFTLYEGNAYTNDLYMRAPAARIDIAGRVGLANKDYDQLATVTPEVSSTFAIGGALAAGPVGAATALIAQQLFKGQIEKTVARQYRISGSWSDPEVVRLQEPTVDPDEDET